MVGVINYHTKRIQGPQPQIFWKQKNSTVSYQMQRMEQILKHGSKRYPIDPIIRPLFLDISLGAQAGLTLDELPIWGSLPLEVPYVNDGLLPI